MAVVSPVHREGTARSAPVGARLHVGVHGVVQGVGFRPFVWRLAQRHCLTGFVRNTSGAVVIEVQGQPAALEAFVRALRSEAPRLARILAVDVEEIPAERETGFAIVESRRVDGEHLPIAPDAATCDACIGELFDSRDRRHLYPFINCTDCGPRFTIIEDVPYDRALTTMRGFEMCASCRAEYDDPADRRFHAQPNACAECGPRLWYADAAGAEHPGDAVQRAVGDVLAGEIVAVKGLGGFQLCCDATSETAVALLRARKHRPAKPFAVLCSNLEQVREHCGVDAEAAALLESPARPIVLLRRRDGSHLAGGVAPGLGEVGIMLPSTPLHHLLLRAAARPLVMTSGNLSEEPIARTNADAQERLAGIATAFLLNDRDIHSRYDDSVMRVAAGAPRTVRRARGLCPLPLDVAAAAPPVLALGAHLKNTFCLLSESRAFVGPHLGDLDNPLTLLHQDEALRTYLHLFRVSPRIVAADLHPDYASTRIAERWWEAGAAVQRVQHHHAHIASVMAEHGLRGRLLGVALDGTGLGPDGTVWGGELLLCDERDYTRVGSLRPVRQPGGDACAREGWRMAIAYLSEAGALSADVPAAVTAGGDAPDPRRWRLVSNLARSQRAPVSTSAGRLFDAVASLLGVAQVSSFEAEAAMRLEALASHGGGGRPVPVEMRGAPLVLDTVSLVADIAEQHRRGRPAAELASSFHESLALGLAGACHQLAREHGIRRVALSGGVFQNALLLVRLTELLREAGLEVHTNCDVPANDGGVSLGQALVAASRHAEAA